MQTEKVFLIIVELGNSSNMQRIAKDIPGILSVFKRLSNGLPEQVFRSDNGRLFGYFTKSKKSINFFRAEFEKSGSTINEDTILVLEVGEQFTGLGFSRAWTWLQHKALAQAVH